MVTRSVFSTHLWCPQKIRSAPILGELALFVNFPFLHRVEIDCKIKDSDAWVRYLGWILYQTPWFFGGTSLFQKCYIRSVLVNCWPFPDLVSRLHVQLRLLSNLGQCGGIPWLLNTDGALCYICKKDKEDVGHFLCDCGSFKENFDSIWSNLNLKVLSSNPTDGVQIANFIASLGRQGKVLLLVGGLSLPFDRDTVILIKRFLCSAVGKVYKLR